MTTVAEAAPEALGETRTTAGTDHETGTRSQIHGWLVLDKPLGMTSGRAVGRVRRLFGVAKAGHAGTLDPLATGILPIALGEATKTVAWAMAGAKTYRTRVAFGEERSTDDAEGHVTRTSAVRPDPAAVEAALAAFVGWIEQVPPVFSAIKVAGRRAYRLARAAETVVLAPRRVEIRSLRLVGVPGPDAVDLEVVTGKGVYIRSLARDLARRLGTVGHVAALRRVRVGPFGETAAISLDMLEALTHSPALRAHLLPVETALVDIPALALTEEEALRLRHGQGVASARSEEPGSTPPLPEGAIAYAVSAGRVVALTELRDGMIRPVRVLNL